jgi:MFS family permease
MSEAHDPYAALRHPHYRRLLLGSVLASAASEMLSVAIGWEIYQRTERKDALGYVGLVLFLPVVLLSLPAGHFADRHNRKAILLGTQLLAVAACIGLALLSFSEEVLLQHRIAVIYGLLLLLGAARAFGAPARWALVSQLVPAQTLGNAIAWNSSGWQVASMTGPALGGLVIWLTDRAAWTYVLSAAGWLMCVGLVASLRPRGQPRLKEELSVRSLLAGVRFVWQTKLILATITLDLFAVLLGGATALLPVFAKDILEVGPAGLGCLRAAPSAGALVMALTMAHRPPLRRAGQTLLLAVGGYGLATIVFGLSQNFLLSLAVLAVTGALDNISVVVRGTLVQVLTPDAMRGRVSSVNMIFISSSNEIGAFESGMTAQWFGPVASVVGGGIGTILVVLGVLSKWPEVLRLGSLRAAEVVEPADEERPARGD